MLGETLKRPQFMLIGYRFISLFNNMGIVCYLLFIFIFFLLIKLALYAFESKVDSLPKHSKLRKYINFSKNMIESLYNYFAVNQIISMTSLVIYLWYEYVEKECF